MKVLVTGGTGVIGRRPLRQRGRDLLAGEVVFRFTGVPGEDLRFEVEACEAKVRLETARI